jgi:two-component system cell cycle sensor histidine kinase/response regulator CckA
MATPLRVLFVEDYESDMLLQLRDLRLGGYEPTFRRVQTPDALLEALAENDWQVVLSDYSMPAFTGLEALKLVQQSGRDIPFILVSGTAGEEVAIECLKAGAADYLRKGALTRLVPAVRREVRDAEERRRRRRAESELRHSQSLLSLIYDHTNEMLALFSADDNGELRVVSVNRAWLDFAQRLGRSRRAPVWGAPLTRS